ncbi:hypothetical protein [Lichenibacterium dinghuense]|uniref:hypothetical protein n=1 Tax=Lichenibacterium dinghuense TaxID=2895977 RepID=UPI001F30A348|nr:hypothetical protein [Lichenibacterium sp. 6Y81]
MDADFRTWNVFRRRSDGGLCCAVPAEAPVPRFLLCGEWDFGFAITDGGRPVRGFCPFEAEAAAGSGGFHLFLAFVPPLGTAPGGTEARGGGSRTAGSRIPS